MYDREQYFFEAIAAGAAGYVLKRQADRDLVDACRAALRGEPFVHPAALGSLMSVTSSRSALRATAGRPLTPRESEVVKLIAEGHTTPEIAELLTLSPKPSNGTARTSSTARPARPCGGHPLRHPLRPHRALRFSGTIDLATELNSRARQPICPARRNRVWRGSKHCVTR